MRARTAVLITALLLVAGPVLAEEADQDAKAKFGYDKGFKFESADGRFSLGINNRVQVRFTFEDPDEGDNVGSFRLRRYKFKMSGKVFEDWKYQLQVNFAGQGDQTIPIGGNEITIEQDDALEDAWFQYTKYSWFQPWLGQGKTFFGRERLHSSGNLLFVDRALLSDQAEVERDDGVGLVGYGKEHKFEYNVGVYNGNFLNQRANDNDKFAYAGRFVWTPFGAYKLSEGAVGHGDGPKLALGVDAYDNVITTETGADLEITLYGPEFAFTYKGWSVQAEYYRIHLDLASGGTGDIDTGYLMAGYLLPGERIEVGARYAMSDPDDDAQEISNEADEIGVVFNYYFAEHRYKIQADLRQIDEKAADGNDSLEFRAQMQFSF